MKSIRVFLVDDHTGVRQAVRLALEAEEGIEVVGETADGGEAIRESIRLRPDVAVVDLTMPERPGLGVIAEVRARSPATAVVVFTMHRNTAYVAEAIRAGARGYVLKSAAMSELVAAVRAVARGEAYLQSELTGSVLQRLAGGGVRPPETPLTARELQILEALADGRTNREIAELLSIAEDTVKTQLKRLYQKLGAADRAQAVAIALRQRLID